jgi:hypothetical protein
MKISTFMMVTALFIGAILSIPALASPNVPIDNAHVKINSMISGDAVVNETVSLIWSEGTGDSAKTYEWKQTKTFENPDNYTTHTLFDMTRGNESTSWDYQHWNTEGPSWTLNDQSIMQPQYLVSEPVSPVDIFTGISYAPTVFNVPYIAMPQIPLYSFNPYY